MFAFALRNLLRKPLRSFLALLGVSVSILGVVGLLSFSGGVRQSVRETLDKVEGLVVIRHDSVDPIFSILPETHREEIRRVPGVCAVIAEIWKIQPEIQGESLFTGGVGLLDMPAIFGIDAQEVARRPKASVFCRSMVEGRFLAPESTDEIVISRTTAKKYKRGIGERLSIGTREFRIVGLYETGTFFLDVALILPLDVARELSGIGPGLVTNFFVEVEEGADPEAVAAAIEDRLEDSDAKTTREWGQDFGRLMGEVDLYLSLIASVAVLVGAIGILNTMLMSVTERTAEFGIVRANGWTRKDVVRLVLYESILLGVTGGVAGCLLGVVGVAAVGRMHALQPSTPPELIAAALLTAAVFGVIGGVYPAYRASRMSPVEALRYG